MNTYSKILGGLLGGAVADAMGAATETRSPILIKERFGGYVKELIAAPEDTFGRGLTPVGFVTDDFSLAYFTAVEIARNKGVINDEVARNALITWSEHPEFFDNYAGPTTRAAVMKLKGEHVETPNSFLACDNNKATNGSAMKISPVGFVTPGDLDKTIDNVFTICKDTHFNNLCLSGASAVACAVSRAMEQDADLYSVVQAGLYGARTGMDRGNREATRLAGPSVEKRMQLAIEIGLKYSHDWETAMLELGDVVGSSIHISESVPAVFGCLVATAGNPMESIYMGVNIGNDTDTVATMAGAIAGTLKGHGAFRADHLEIINKANNFNLEQLAKDLADCL
ncbi:MAG: ADP-ribosylglycohydrolase family protein [Angelakisella sp.]